MDGVERIKKLEADLNDFNPAVRRQALEELNHMVDMGVVDLETEHSVVNMHCHTFFSFNAYGYSPSGLAWLGKKNGYQVLGTVDFDVLDAVDEFLSACDLLGIRGSTGIETRIYIPEFATREMNSPGEPGVAYHMGIGFTSSFPSGEAGNILTDLRERARQRNIAMVERLNHYLSPVEVDYERDVLPLTPGGTATERHIVVAYIRAAEKLAGNTVEFWSNKLNLAKDQVSKQVSDAAGFQNLVRSKLMKSGGAGYVQPTPDIFPKIEPVNQMTRECGALPCFAWLDGTSTGEQDIEELLALMIAKGAVVINIVPDRNWNISDSDMRKKKVQNLYRIVKLAQDADLPINVGTEMNSFGQKKVDDFNAPELLPVRQAFIDGAYFIYGHTVLQRALGDGYQSEWAKKYLPSRKERKDFFTKLGSRVKPGLAGLKLIKQQGTGLRPDEILSKL